MQCGVDEAGRGPLAGPVFAAAVILDPARAIIGLADSKKLSERARDQLAQLIRENAMAYSIASASIEEIDRLKDRLSDAERLKENNMETGGEAATAQSSSWVMPTRRIWWL